MSFNPDEYFSQQVAQEQAADRLRGTSTRFEELQAASREKELLLTQAAERNRARIAADQKSLVSTLGLDPDGNTAGAVNLAASLIAGASQHLVGNMAALPSNILASVGTIGVSDEDRAAYARYKQNAATPEDLVLLSRKEIEGKADSITVADKLATEEQQLATARGIRDSFNIDYLKQDDNANALNDQLSESFQRDWGTVKTGWKALTGEAKLDGFVGLSKGLGNLLFNAVDAGIDNPMAVSEFVMQNVPQLAMGATKGAQVALGATNVSYAYDNYTKGIENYQAANNGEYPPEEARREIAAWAASLALAEQVGDATALRTVFGGAKKAGVDVAEEAAQKGITQAVLRTAKAGAEGVATEAATEGFQTFAESQTGANGYMKDPVTGEYLRDTDGNLIAETASAEEIYRGAVIGGLSGGGLSGGGRAIGESAELVADSIASMNTPTIEAPKAAQMPVIQEAVKTGDVSKLADPESPQYAPEKAVAALQEWATIEGTPEAWDKAQSEAQAIVDRLETVRTGYAMELAATTPEGQKALEADIVESKKLREKMVEKGLPAERLAAQDEYITELETELTAARAAPAAKATAIKKELDGVTRLLESVRPTVTALQQSRTAQPDEGVTAESALAVAPLSADTPATPAKPKDTLTLSMQAPERVTPEAAREMAADTSNELLPEQRAYLEAFATAREQENLFGATASVRNEVLEGSDKNMGLKQHRSSILSALNSGTPRQLAYSRGLLQKFQAGHQAKLVRIQEELKTNASAHTPKHVAAVTTEVNTINALVAEMDALVAAREAVKAAPAKTEAKAPVAALVEAEAKVEPVAQVAEEPTAETVTPEPAQVVETTETGTGLRALEAKTAPDTTYRLRVLGDFFTQNQGSKTARTTRPLAAARDFVSSVYSKAVNLMDFVSEETLSEKQRTALNTFFKTAQDWSPTIRGNLQARIAPEIRINDLMQYFMEDGVDGKADLEENTKTAIAYGAYRALIDLANDPEILNDKAINSVLGRPKDGRVPTSTRLRMQKVGKYQHLVRNSIGQHIMDSLGLKPNKDCPQDLAAGFIEVLGAHGLKLLEDKGLIQRTDIPNKEIQALRKTGLNETQQQKLATEIRQDDDIMHTFFAVKREEGKLPTAVQTLVEANRGTKDILAQVFKTEPSMKAPALSPIKGVQKFAAGTKQGVPAALARTIKQNQGNARQIRRDTWSLLKLIEETDRASFESILGFESVDPRVVHKSKIDGIKAKNDTLLREWELFNEFVDGYLQGAEDGLRSNFYLEFNVWKQHRVGIATTMVNPQTSKLVRFLVGSPEWTTEIDSSNEEQMMSFWLRVAEGFGHKVERVSNATSRAKIEAMFQPEGEYSAAIKALIKSVIQQEELTDAERISIVEAVGDNRAHGLDALIAVAYWQAAKDTAENPVVFTFTTQMLGEVDGVANGTVLNHILYGAAATGQALNKLLKVGGIYTTDAGHSNFNLWKESNKANLDIYQLLAKRVFAEVVKYTPSWDDSQNAQVSAVWAVLGKIFNQETGEVTGDGRNLMKDGVNPLAFGASMSRVKEGMGEKLVAGIYDKFEEFASGKEPMANLRQFVAQVNTLIDNPKMNLPVGRPIEWYMSYTLSDAQEAAVAQAFSQTVGDVVESVLERTFSAFLERRTEMTGVTSLAFKLYDALYQGTRQEFVEELIANGTIPRAVLKDGKLGKPERDLTFAEEAEVESRVKAAMPVLNTFFSRKDKAEANTGLRPAKTKTLQNYNDAYTKRATFGKPFTSTGKKSATTRGQTLQFIDPGVAMVSASTHSEDSAISHLTQETMDVLNIHDAVATGVLKLKDAARLMNHNTWKVMLGVSPLEEAYLALERMVLAMTSLAQDNKLSSQAKQNLLDVLQKSDYWDSKSTPGMALRALLGQSKLKSYQADKVKLEAMSSWGAVDQYAYQGGEYQVTEADRAEAAAKLTALTPDLSPKVQTAIDVLAEALNNNTKKEAPQNIAAQEVALTVVQEENPDSDEAGESTLEADRESLRNGLNKRSFMEMAQVLSHGAKNPKITAADRATLNEWLVLLQQGTLMWEGVVQRVQEMGSKISSDVLAILEVNFDSGTLFGTQGTPVIAPNQELVNLFQESETPSLKSVLHTLTAHYRAQPDGRTRNFNMALLERVGRVLPTTLQFQVITPETDPKTLRSIPVTQSYGWFSANSSGQNIYVMGPQFKESNLNPDMLLHELVHGALAQVIAQELKAKASNPKYTSEVLDLVNELDTLRVAATKFAEEAGIISEYQAALADVQEFVAWGLTNQRFQRNVLNKVTMTSTTFKNRFVTAAQKFIKAITGILFHGSDKSRKAIAENGMALLISNTSGLFAAVAEQHASNQPQDELTLSMAAQVQAYSTQDVLQELIAKGTPRSGNFHAHLESLLQTMVTRLHGPFGSLKAALSQSAAGSAEDQWLKALASGQAPFASRVRVSPFAVSDAELFMIEQIEVTVRQALEGDQESQGSFAAQELRRLFMEMRKNLVKGQDLTPEQYDFLFRVEGNGQTTSDYLSRFAAMVLAHEEVRDLAALATTRSLLSQQPGGTMGIGERVQRWLLEVLQFFTSQFAGTRMNTPGDQRARALVQRLVDIEAQRKHLLQNPVQELLEGPAKALGAVAEGARKQVAAIVDSDWVQNRAFQPIRVVGKAVSLVVNDRLEASAAGAIELRDKVMASKSGFVTSMLTEVVGHREKLVAMLRHSKVLENVRKDVITGQARAALAAFANGKGMTRDQKAGVTQVFLRSGAHVLLGRYSVPEIINLAGDKVLREAAMAKLESELMTIGGSQHGVYFKQQAQFTGYYKATGRNISPMLMMNGHNIAAMYGTAGAEQVTSDQINQATPVIEALIALSAMHYVPQKHRDSAMVVARTEATRNNGENGIEYLLRSHAQLDHQARQTTFKGKEALLMHGFTPEIYNPYVEIKVGLAKDQREMELMGYTFSHVLTPSVGEVRNEQEAIYVLRGAGMSPYMSGVIALNSQSAKGTLLHEYNQVSGNSTQTPAQAMAAVSKAREIQVQGLFRDMGIVDLNGVSQEYSAPVVNATGAVVNYRHLMHEKTKDTMLERDNGFDQVLGTLAGSLFDKENVPSHNAESIKALHTVFKEEYVYTPSAFIQVGPRSPDAELRNYWNMLSPEAKTLANRMFGEGGLWVPKNAVDLMLGYRKTSLGDMFAKQPGARKWYEDAVVTMVEGLLYQYGRMRKHLNHDDAVAYSNRARVIVAKGDRMWQELVREIKDIIVVKTGMTLLGNMTSNWFQLHAEGLSWAEIFRYTQVALRGALDHRRDSEQLERLQNQLATGFFEGDPLDIQSEINRLRDSIQRNPITQDIEAGLMPSIVEDVQDDVDPYSYKSGLTELVQGKLGKLGKAGSPLRNVARWAYMTKDTWAYQGLSRMTQLSDFTARHALRQHLMNRKENPMTAEESAAAASNAFINYDVPMHRVLQALDDRGLLMFTKYAIRVQPVLLRLFREKPLNMASMLLFHHYIDAGPVITDSGIFNRVGNPLETGAFGIFGAIDETATVAGALSLID